MTHASMDALEERVRCGGLTTQNSRLVRRAPRRSVIGAIGRLTDRLGAAHGVTRRQVRDAATAQADSVPRSPFSRPHTGLVVAMVQSLDKRGSVCPFATNGRTLRLRSHPAPLRERKPPRAGREHC